MTAVRKPSSQPIKKIPGKTADYGFTLNKIHLIGLMKRTIRPLFLCQYWTNRLSTVGLQDLNSGFNLNNHFIFIYLYFQEMSFIVKR